ncbi:conserved oligomeric Golgi complex subunit 4 [Diaphorina citri]|uniref:Conserved oligomeric Golgi complex subunit 4 n=1 Tax=Diaphorina citri TaxID=121845 RepID=A0A3Q0IRI8_DIACI|nr:conserved oligomeric Golgi complex subunit 4 [Diaphorina citri]
MHQAQNTSRRKLWGMYWWSHWIHLELRFGKPQTPVKTVAVLGAGLMGAGIAHVTVDKGYNTIVKDSFGKPQTPVKTVAVLGAGLMGAGIAHVTVDKGYNTIVKDSFEKGLARGLGQIKTGLDGAVKRKKMSAEVDKKLVEFLSLKTELESDVHSISESMPNLHIVKSEAKELEEMVNFTSTLAEKVSSKVRQLDLARSRVSDCQKRVHDLLDLQLCSNGVETCLQSEDYEKAAAHIHRFLSMDQNLLKQTADDMFYFNECIRKSELCRKMQEILGNFLLLERYYMEESVKKAISMDVIEESCLQSSMLDDVFFILRKSIRRACTGGSMDGICAVINNGSLVLEDQFLNAIHQYLRLGYPSGYLDLTQAYNVVMQGRNDSEQSRVQFLTYLNNLEVAAEYVTTLIQSLNEEIPCSSQRDKEKLQSCLSGLSGVTSSLSTVKEYGLQQLRSAAIKPRVAPWIDVYLTLNHNLTEEEFVAYEANEPFIGSLVMHLDTLLAEFKPRLTQANYDSLVCILALEVTSHLERVIVKCEFNRLGGMTLDKEVRGLVSYLSGATSWTIRDRLARLMQISTVLNLDKVSEISDYISSATWRLSTSDVRQFMSLRKDFSNEDIMRL